MIEDAGTILHIYSLIDKNVDMILPFVKDKDKDIELSFSKIIMLTYFSLEYLAHVEMS